MFLSIVIPARPCSFPVPQIGIAGAGQPWQLWDSPKPARIRLPPKRGCSTCLWTGCPQSLCHQQIPCVTAGCCWPWLGSGRHRVVSPLSALCVSRLCCGDPCLSQSHPTALGRQCHAAPCAPTSAIQEGPAPFLAPDPPRLCPQGSQSCWPCRPRAASCPVGCAAPRSQTWS